MNSLPKYIFITAMLVGLLRPIDVVAKGGVATGGGTSCRASDVNQHRPILLDLATPGLRDAGFVDSNGERLQLSKFGNWMGLERLDTSRLQTFRYAKGRLHAWALQALELSAFEESLDHLEIFVTSYEWTNTHGAALESGSLCKAKDLRPVVLYTKNRVFVSIQQFNSFGFYSQAGIFIHEMLRQQQYLLETPLSDLEVQSLTARLLLESPHTEPELFKKLRSAKSNSQKTALNSISDAKIGFCSSLALNNLKKLRTAQTLLQQTFPLINRFCADANTDEQELSQKIIDNLQQSMIFLANQNTRDSNTFQSIAAYSSTQELYEKALRIQSTYLAGETYKVVDKIKEAVNSLNVISDADLSLIAVAHACFENTSCLPGTKDYAAAAAARKRFQSEMLSTETADGR